MSRFRRRPALTHATATALLARLTALDAVLMKQAGTRGLAEAPEALVLMVRALVAETRALLDAPAESDRRPAGRRGGRAARFRRSRAHGHGSGAGLPALPRAPKGKASRAAPVSFAELAIVAGQARAVLAAHVAARGLDRPVLPRADIDAMRSKLVRRLEQMRTEAEAGSEPPAA